MFKKGALTGINVLDLSRLLPGPYCSMILADHGARVIALEDKRFMADDLFITTVNRNKEHMSLNLKTFEGKEIFFRLIKQVDIMLEGFRPGVVKRLGIDYETVRKINPKIIYCAITGYGQDGPYRNRPGHDNNFLSYSGVLDLIGHPDRPPCIPGVQIADIVGGGMNAVTGILLALFAREKTGKGQYIDISMTDGIMGLLSLPLFLQQRNGKTPQRGNSTFSHRYACYNTYETSDGKYISIGAVENRFWKNLCEYLKVPQYSDLQYDENLRLEIIEFMRKTFKTKSMARWEAEFSEQQICWAPVRNLEEVLQDPFFQKRKMVVDMKNHDGGKIPAIGIPVKLSETPGSIRSAPVDFGENTIAILRELGYTEKQIKIFADKSVF